MTYMDVTSSAINAIKYNYITKCLEVEFAAGELYEYKNVPFTVLEKMLHCSEVGESVGALFNNEIRKEYSFERLQ